MTLSCGSALQRTNNLIRAPCSSYDQNVTAEGDGGHVHDHVVVPYTHTQVQQDTPTSQKGMSDAKTKTKAKYLVFRRSM
jgi:hypothetical protein